MIYLIGSQALKLQCPEFKGKCNDIDIIVDDNSDTIPGAKRVECHSIDHLNNREIVENFSGDVVFFMGTKVTLITLEGLAAIKRSHLWRSYFFPKHMTQYVKHLKEHMTPLAMEVAKRREKLTRTEYPQGNPNLNQRNEDFFDDAVEKIYDHDMLHEMVAYYDRPIYTRLKFDETLAKCEKDLWKDLSHEDKMKCVAEETFVIASERFLIRNNWNHPFKLAYIKALEKVCTTLTSGWFRSFAIDNYEEILNLFDKNRFETLREKLIEFDSLQS